jgi:hypothetical protein
MIALDSDVLLVDMRYGRDQRFPVNRQVLDHLRSAGLPRGITCHTLLEVLGVSCFNLAPRDLLDLAIQVPANYGLTVLPDPAIDPGYAGLNFQDIRDQIATRLSLGDALTVLQLEKFIPQAVCFLSWNARHFHGRLKIPVMTPEQWWLKNAPTP